MGRSVGLFALATSAVLWVSCSNPSEPDSNRDTLVFTREDQSEVPFSSDAVLYAWCGPWEEGEVATPTLHVLFAGPGFQDPLWYLRAVIADVTVGEPNGFPNGFAFDQPTGVDLFVFDPPNELSTQDDGSSGTITFQNLPCETGAVVEFSIDAVVGSEFQGGAPVHVGGTLRASIGEPPS